MTDFLNNYKPISKFIDFNKLKLSQYIDFVEDKDGYYYGEIVNQFRNGQGVLYEISGAVYEGRFIITKDSGPMAIKMLRGFRSTKTDPFMRETTITGSTMEMESCTT